MKKLIFILSALCLIGTACRDKESPANLIDTTNLVNTKWKLVGIVDAKTGALTELEPKDCEECYTLTFDADSSFFTFSPSNELEGCYIADYEVFSFQITCFGGTKVGEIGDAELYTDLFWHRDIQSFSIQENELRLYYNDKKNYLLFNKKKNDKNCEWTELSPVILTEQLKSKLDMVFSESNELVENIKGDTLLRVINSKEELSAISRNINTVIDIDFENQSLIWGKFLTSSISNSIVSKRLFVCQPNADYKYKISVQKCTDCWEALGYLYFWGIYPQKINANDVSLVIN